MSVSIFAASVTALTPTSTITMGRVEEEAAANRRRYQLLATVVVVALALIGTLVALPFGAWPTGLGAGLAVAILLVGFAPGLGERLALRTLAAKPADPGRHPRYQNLVEGLCGEAGLPVPKLWVVESEAANALALGRNPAEATIVVTSGLLSLLNRVELEGVLAAELSHIRSSSARLGAAAVVLGGAGGLLVEARRRGGNALLGAAGAVLLALAPLRRLAAPPERHVQADEGAAYLTRYPPGLLRALSKLDDQKSGAAAANLGLNHLWIVAPGGPGGPGGPGSGLERLFESHPPMDERLENLRDL